MPQPAPTLPTPTLIGTPAPIDAVDLDAALDAFQSRHPLPPIETATTLEIAARLTHAPRRGIAAVPRLPAPELEPDHPVWTSIWFRASLATAALLLTTAAAAVIILPDVPPKPSVDSVATAAKAPAETVGRAAPPILEGPAPRAVQASMIPAPPDRAVTTVARFDPPPVAAEPPKPPEPAPVVAAVAPLATPAPPADPAREQLRARVRAEAVKRKVPEALALAYVELASGWDVKKKGDNGEIGLTQVTLSIAEAYGFKGDSVGLRDPETNIRYGMSYLGGAYRKAGNDLCRTAMKAMSGHPTEVMKPAHQAYCDRLKAAMATEAPAAQ